MTDEERFKATMARLVNNCVVMIQQLSPQGDDDELLMHCEFMIVSATDVMRALHYGSDDEFKQKVKTFTRQLESYVEALRRRNVQLNDGGLLP